MTDDRTLPVGPDDDRTLPLDRAEGAARPDEDVGAVIGPYHLVRRLGQGGMGDVFLAEQQEPIKRRVALKVIKQGMDTRAVVARFDAERHALALMDHPCIAKVLDAGATARGRPFFVMEYVDGEPITDYCNRCHLGTRERLDLFVRVCEGVQHAHQKAVIHRDLKPSNILVTEVDGRPVPKIIDFGVAKATTQRLTEMTMFTEMGQIIGTPEYMSPEQAGGNIDDIDTRTDVYALGVVLYELLAGALPFESRELRKAGYDAIRRIILEQEPPRPSTRFSHLGERASAVATDRGTEPRRLSGELRGDLDWITMKALEKDRNRRYETANGLAADVKRHLRSEPVVAGPPSASYRLGKLVRRNRRAFAALGLVAAAMVLATVVSSVMYLRAERASQVARREASKSEQVSRFLGDMLAGVGPHVAQGSDTKLLRGILEDTDERIGEELADQPEVEATLRLQMSHTYRQLGDFPSSQAQVDRVHELQAKFGLESPDPAEVAVAAGVLAWNRGDTKGAEALFRQSLTRPSGASPVDSLVWAESTTHLASVLQEMGAYAEADSLLRGPLSYFRRLPRESDSLAVVLNTLGNLARYQGDFPAAEGFYSEALAIHRRVLGDHHPYVATDLHNLGRLLDAMGRSAEGEQLLTEAMAIQERAFEGPHADKIMTLRALAEFAKGAGRFAQADSLARAAWAMSRDIYGERDNNTIRAMMIVADVKARQGLLPEAEVIIADLVTAARDTANTDPELLSSVLYRLASLQSQQGHNREALASFTEAIESSTALAGADHPNTLLYRNDYARVLANLGQDETVLEQLQLVLTARESALGATHPQTAITRADLGRCLSRLGRNAEAESLLRQARTDYAAANGADHPGCWFVTVHLAGVLRDLGSYDEAEQELRSAETHYVNISGEGHADTRWTRARLSTVYLRAGRTGDADRLLAQSMDPSLGEIEPRLRGRMLGERGDTLLKMGRLDDAARTFESAFTILEAAVGPVGADTQSVVRQLVKVSEQRNRPQDTARWRAKLA